MSNLVSDRGVSRRGLFRSALSVAIAASVGGNILGAASAEATSRQVPLVLQTFSLKELNLHHLLPVVADAGFKSVDLYDRHVSPLASQADLSDAEADFAKTGVGVDGLYTEKLTVSPARCRQIFETAKRLGVRVLTTSVTADVLAMAAPIAADFDIALAIHNAGPAPGKLFVSLDDVRRGLEVHPAISACLDIGNFYRAGTDPLEAIEALAGRIAAVHIKDLDADGAHVLIGEGILDLEGAIGALRRANYNNPLTLEYTGSAGDIEARIAHLAYNRLKVETLVSAA